jgi:hypothetical protein
MGSTSPWGKSEIPENKVTLHSSDLIFRVMDDLAREVEAGAGTCDKKIVLIADETEIHALTAAEARERAAKAGATVRKIITTIRAGGNTGGEESFLRMEGSGFQDAEPNVRYTTSGPAANLWAEITLCVVKPFRRADPERGSPRGEKRIRRMVRRLLSFLSGKFLWPVLAGLVVAILAAWLGLR